MNAPLPQPVHGFPRAEVDAFLAAAASERVRLEAEIADANARIARARSAVGTHRVMVAMLLEAQRELTEIRRNAEVEAERILGAAELEAQSIERGAPSVSTSATAPAAGSAAGSAAAPTFAAAPSSPSRSPEPTIDLAAAANNGKDDEFFDFLRGALTDDQPLGPASE